MIIGGKSNRQYSLSVQIISLQCSKESNLSAVFTTDLKKIPSQK